MNKSTQVILNYVKITIFVHDVYFYYHFLYILTAAVLSLFTKSQLQCHYYIMYNYNTDENHLICF